MRRRRRWLRRRDPGLTAGTTRRRSVLDRDHRRPRSQRARRRQRHAHGHARHPLQDGSRLGRLLREHLAQRRRQRAHRLEPLVWSFGQGRQDDRLQIRRDPADQRRRRRRRRVAPGPSPPAAARPLNGTRPSAACTAARRTNRCRCGPSRRLVTDLLGRHVARRPEGDAGPRQVRALLRAGDTEVEQLAHLLAVAPASEEHVRHLEVAMDEPRVVDGPRPPPRSAAPTSGNRCAPKRRARARGPQAPGRGPRPEAAPWRNTPDLSGPRRTNRYRRCWGDRTTRSSAPRAGSAFDVFAILRQSRVQHLSAQRRLSFVSSPANTLPIPPVTEQANHLVAALEHGADEVHRWIHHHQRPSWTPPRDAPVTCASTTPLRSADVSFPHDRRSTRRPRDPTRHTSMSVGCAAHRRAPRCLTESRRIRPIGSPRSHPQARLFRPVKTEPRGSSRDPRAFSDVQRRLACARARPRRRGRSTPESGPRASSRASSGASRTRALPPRRARSNGVGASPACSEDMSETTCL